MAAGAKFPPRTPRSFWVWLVVRRHLFVFDERWTSGTGCHFLRNSCRAGSATGSVLAGKAGKWNFAAIFGKPAFASVQIQMCASGPLSSTDAAVGGNRSHPSLFCARLARSQPGATACASGSEAAGAKMYLSARNSWVFRSLGEFSWRACRLVENETFLNLKLF